MSETNEQNHYELLCREAENPGFTDRPFEDLINFYVSLSNYVKRNGLLAMEEIVEKLPMDYAQGFLWEVVSGVDPGIMFGRGMEKARAGSDGELSLKIAFHLFAALLLQNGVGGGSLNERLQAFCSQITPPVSEADFKKIEDYIRAQHGTLMIPVEHTAAELLRGHTKEYDRARELLSSVEKEKLGSDSLYNLALINYLDNDDWSIAIGLEYAIAAAEKGHRQAVYTAGHQLLTGVPGFSENMNGLVTPADEKTAIMGYTPYPRDVVTEKDIPRGIELLEKAAGQGSVNACMTLAEHYGAAGNAAQTFAWLQKGVDNGSEKAAEIMGDSFSGRPLRHPFTCLVMDPGSLTDDNYKGAIGFYYKAYRNLPDLIPRILETIFLHLNPGAYPKLLSELYKYLNDPFDFDTALVRFFNDEEHEKIAAEDILGVAYFGGIVRPDLEKAFFYLNRAYSEGRKTGYTVYLLALLYLKKDEGFTSYDPVKAHSLFMEAADLGHLPSAQQAGFSCFSGMRAYLPAKFAEDPGAAESEAMFASPVTDAELNLKDLEKAEKYLKQAADKGHLFSCLRLADLYASQNNPAEDNVYRRKASWFGDSNSSLAVSLDYARRGFAEHYNDIVLYCTIAALQQDSGAYYSFVSMLEEEETVTLADADLNRFLEMSAGIKCKYCALMLGLRLYAGVGCEPDESAAMEYLVRAEDFSAYENRNGYFNQLEIDSLRALAEIYGNPQSSFYDAAKPEPLRQKADSMEAEMKQSQAFIDDLLMPRPNTDSED